MTIFGLTANVGDQVSHALLGEQLGEQGGPVGLHGDVGGLQDGVDVVSGDLQTIVVEDQSRVGAGKLGLGHFSCMT